MSCFCVNIKKHKVIDNNWYKNPSNNLKFAKQISYRGFDGKKLIKEKSEKSENMQPIKKSFSLPCLLSKLFIFIEFLIYEISNPISVNDDDSCTFLLSSFPTDYTKIPQEDRREINQHRNAFLIIFKNGSYSFVTDPIQ